RTPRPLPTSRTLCSGTPRWRRKTARPTSASTWPARSPPTASCSTATAPPAAWARTRASWRRRNRAEDRRSRIEDRGSRIEGGTETLAFDPQSSILDPQSSILYLRSSPPAAFRRGRLRARGGDGKIVAGLFEALRPLAGFAAMRDPFTWSLPLGRVFGITVRVHILFIIFVLVMWLRVA